MTYEFWYGVEAEHSINYWLVMIACSQGVSKSVEDGTLANADLRVSYPALS
jgi:hypothetical protein